MEHVISLINGEVMINASGIYTFVHYYWHPETAHKVILIGTSHVGDRAYYKKIKQILDRCDVVLYEALGSGDRELANKDDVSIIDALFNKSAENAFSMAMRLFFNRAPQSLYLTYETEVFKDLEPYWLIQRTQLSSEEEIKMFKKVFLQMQEIPYSRKKEIVDYVKEIFAKIEKGEFTKEDFVQGFIFILSDPQIVALASTGAMVRERNKYVFEKFDALIKERNSKVVGFKFGSGHTCFQRSLLGQRGYVYQTKKKLCNIRFSYKNRIPSI